MFLELASVLKHGMAFWEEECSSGNLLAFIQRFDTDQNDMSKSSYITFYQMKFVYVSYEQHSLNSSTQNTIVMHNTCEDSLLATPLILDLVILCELCERITVRYVL